MLPEAGDIDWSVKMLDDKISSIVSAADDSKGVEPAGDGVSFGDIVLSKNGRFANHYFVVLKVEDNFVYIANGKTRKVDSPKKKKIKHIQVIGKSEHITSKMANGEKITNAEVRRSLAKAKGETDE